MTKICSIEDVQAQVLTLVEDIPFGNSDTQNRLVIVNGERTPCRALRHAALRIMNRLEALRQCKYELRKRALEAKILERDLANEQDDLKRELIALEIEQKHSGDAFTHKLIKDAIREIESLWPVLRSMGAVTRERFEAEEITWYSEKHSRKITTADDLYERIQSQPAQGAWLPDIRALIDIDH